MSALDSDGTGPTFSLVAGKELCRLRQPERRGCDLGQQVAEIGRHLEVSSLIEIAFRKTRPVSSVRPHFKNACEITGTWAVRGPLEN